jgi:hypothetical protein
MAAAATIDRPPNVALELRALEALRIAIETDHDLQIDPEFLSDLAEGQTNLFEAIDVLLHDDLHDRAMIEGLKFVLTDMEARKHRLDTRIETRRALFEQALLIMERPSLERPTATISLAARPAALTVTDEALLPSHFFRAKPVLDRKALREALERGETAPGAHLSNGPMTLTIRRR